MAKLFTSGRIVDYIVMGMLFECIVAIIILNKVSKRFRPVELIVSLSAGLALLLALRAALENTGWKSVAIWLLFALVVHLWDMRLRYAT